MSEPKPLSVSQTTGQIIEQLKAEIAALRKGLSLVATNIGNGSAASPDCSLEFLTVSLPEEVRLVCGQQRMELQSRRENQAAINSEAERMQAEIAELRKDKERMDWLESGNGTHAWDDARLDIDEAMKEGK